jgi:uncharacterized membrane protein YkvI
VVVGGGYAIGRELAEFFLPSGPIGGLMAIGAATLVWSIVCALTFRFSFAYRLLDYRAFFGKLLGRGSRISASLHTASVGSGWLTGGVTYSGYNLVGAVAILPVLRHLTSQRDAIIAGVIAGPLAMLPGLFFFLSMIAWYPEIRDTTLPSDFLLRKMDIPLVRLLFQAMIFFALLDSGCGLVHAIMERARHALRAGTGRDPGVAIRAVLTLLVLTLSMLAQPRFRPD